MTRDFSAEMQAAIDSETAGDSYQAAIVADRIVTKLRTTDPELLSGWLDLHAASILRETIGRRDSAIRVQARNETSRRRFSEGLNGHVAQTMVTQAESDIQDDSKSPLRAIRWFTVPYVVDPQNQRKRLKDLSSEDLAFVEGEYEKREMENRMEKRFIQALATRVTTGVVADHFTEKQILVVRLALKLSV
jgi:hypothetical protein